MGLYRNIAGVQSGNGIGVTISNLKDLFTPPIVTDAPVTTQPPTGGGLTISQPNVVQILPPGTTWGSGQTLQESHEQIQDAFAALAAAKQGYYNYLLSTSPFDLSQAGYFVDDNGSVEIWTDSAHTSSAVYLALMDIQDIENNAGTAGTLFMHMGLPVLAKDTAGYSGGGRASQGSTVMYSTPIADVLAIPATPTGPNVINDYNPPDSVTPVLSPLPDSTGQNGVPTTSTTAPSTLIAGSTLGFLGLGLAALAVIKSRKLLFVGGLGLLYVSMTKTQK